MKIDFKINEKKSEFNITGSPNFKYGKGAVLPVKKLMFALINLGTSWDIKPFNVLAQANLKN